MVRKSSFRKIWWILAFPFLIGSGLAQQKDGAAPASFTPTVVMKLYTDDITVGADGLATHKMHFEEKPNNAAAAQALGQVALRFGEAMEDVEIVEAYTQKTDGRKLPVAPSAIYTQLPQGAPQMPMFDDLRQKVIVFPDVGAGDTIIYTVIYREKQSVFPGKVLISRSFSRLMAYEEARVSLSAPKSLALNVETHDLELQKDDAGDSILYRWHYSAPHPLQEDTSVLSAFDRSPRILVSSFKSYDDFAHTYAILTAAKSAVTPEIKAQADKIVAGVSGHRDRAKKIYEWVSQHIRYVGIEIGAGALIPHDAGIVLANGYGDCKDHVALFSALLKAEGIDSDAVLINLGNAYYLPDTAVLGQLNHVITWLPELHLYADTTAGVAPFGTLPFEEYGKPVIHVVASGPAVRQVPMVAPGAATVAVNTTARLDEHDHIVGESKTVGTGPFSVLLRQFGLGIQAEGPERFAAEALQQLHIPGTAGMTVPSPSDFGPAYELSAQFDLGPFPGLAAGRPTTAPAYFDFLGGPGNWLLGSLSNIKITETDPTPCYSGKMAQTITIKPPEGRHFLTLPADVTLKTAHVAYNAHWSFDGQAVVMRRDFESNFDSALCSGPVRTETAKAIFAIRNSFDSVVALAVQPQHVAQAVVPAEPFTPVPDFFPSNLSLNADAGHFKELRKSLICSVNSIQATLEMDKTASDPKWLSLVQIVLNSPPQDTPPGQDPKLQTAAFWVTESGNAPPTAQLAKRAGADLAISALIPFSAPVALGKPISVFLRWKDDGTVFATVNKTESYSTHLDVPITSIALVTSGADATLSDVQAGFSGDMAARCPAAPAAAHP